jgi:hypothetical protein
LSVFDVAAPHTPARRRSITTTELDAALTAQFVVAWAGEGGEEKRLTWWRTDLIAEFGGLDLFRRLVADTAEWAALQATREAARRVDADLRRQAHDADGIITLFNLGFELDERIDERLQDHKRSGTTPTTALPGLAGPITIHWRADHFSEWVQQHGEVQVVTTPIGRHIKGEPPWDLSALIRGLVAGLAPLSDRYPLVHFRRSS